MRPLENIDRAKVIDGVTYRDSVWDGAQNPQFAFVAKTFVSNESIFDIINVGVVDIGDTVALLSEYAYTPIGKRCLPPGVSPSDVYDVARRYSDDNTDTKSRHIVETILTDIITTVRSLTNDLLWGILNGKDCPKSECDLHFGRASQSHVRIMLSMREALLFLVDRELSEVSSTGVITLTPELKPLVSACLRSYVTQVLFGYHNARTGLECMNEQMEPKTMNIAVSAMAEALVGILAPNLKIDESEDDDDELIGVMTTVEKVIHLVLGSNSEHFDVFTKKLINLAASRKATTNGIFKRRVMSQSGDDTGNVIPGSRLSRATQKSKMLYGGVGKNFIMNMTSQGILPTRQKSSVLPTGGGDGFILVDVTGSTLDNVGNGYGLCILIEAMTQSIVSAFLAAGQNATVYFYDECVVKQVEFSPKDNKTIVAKKMLELLANATTGSNDETTAFQYVFEDIRRKKPPIASIIFITDGECFTGRSMVGNLSGAESFRFEMALLNSASKVDILPVVLNSAISQQFGVAFEGYPYVHIAKGSCIVTSHIRDIMYYIEDGTVCGAIKYAE